MLLLCLGFCLWSSRKVWYLRTDLLFQSGLGFRLGVGNRLFFVLAEVWAGGLLGFESVVHALVFLGLELTTRTVWGCWSRWLLRVETDLDEFLEWCVHGKCKRNELKEVIKIFSSENTIINTLESAIQIDSSFKSSKLRSISIRCYKFRYLYFIFLFIIKHVEQIICKCLSLQIHVTF